MSIVNITSGVYGLFPDYATNQDNTLQRVGDPTHIAYGNNTIARWAAPLFKDYDAPTQIPVLAYHISGIDRIEFQLNNGPVATVRYPSYNATIGATCYNISLDPSIPDNEFNELRAVVYPVSGWPQVLQGEVMGDGGTRFNPIAPANRNLRHGHHSYFFATNFNRSLRKAEFYVNSVTGSNANNGTAPETPKQTIESVLIAAGGTAKEVDGLIIYLMDNNGARVDYDLGTVGDTSLVNSTKVNNLRRYVTFTPYQNANVTLRKRGNKTGLSLNKYRFLNLKIDQPSRSINILTEGRIFSMLAPNAKTFTNPANGKIYSVGTPQYGGVHILVENCTCNFNHNPLFDWAKTKADYVRNPGVNDFDPYGNLIPPDVEINVQTKNAGESDVDFKQRAAKWFYIYSGLTYNPNWRTDSTTVNRDFTEAFGKSVMVETADCTSMCLIGSTFSDMQAFTKGGQAYFINKCHTEKLFEDCWRDVGCGVKCTASDIFGNPFNTSTTLTQDVVGVGLQGSNAPTHAHPDVLQVFPGFGGQSRNKIYYDMNSVDYYSQGPFFEAGASFVGFTLNPNSNISEQYEQRWAEYNFPGSIDAPPAGISSSMIRDVVLDKCTFMQNNKSAAQMFAVIRCLHGNFILQDSIIGKSNYESSTAAYRYDRAFSTTLSGAELEISRRQFHTPIRPSLIKRCRTGSTNTDLDKLFFNLTQFNTTYDTTHGRTRWIDLGRPEYWVTDPLSADAAGSVLIYDQRSESTTTPSGQIQEMLSISNHPITVSLTTTDIDRSISWNSKNSPSGAVAHGVDSFYSTESIIQIPNYLERITEITNPGNNPTVGPSRSNEISGNGNVIVNQGGVYVTGGTKDATLNSQIETMNSIDVKDLTTKFQSIVRTAGGNTFAVILHGKTIPSTEFGEYKYVARQSITEEDWVNSGSPSDANLAGVFYENFYKDFAYISFHSKEAPVSQSITSNQFSFRKSAHHTYINFSRPEMDGLSLSSALNGTSIIDMVTPIVGSKLTKIQTAAIGCTCSFNSYGTESTSASKVSGTSTATTITCKNKNLEYLGFDGNRIQFKNKTASSLFSNTSVRYEHNGAIGSFIQDFQFFNSINDYRFDIPLNEPDAPPVPEASINLRFINPVSSGSKNLLGYKVPLKGIRLFGGTTNIGITAGSYIRISGSPNNNGIYQVLSTIDGIDQDVSSNTANSGLPEYQYLELSRSITAQEQSVANDITIENVSHLPILHVKYRQPL